MKKQRITTTIWNHNSTSLDLLAADGNKFTITATELYSLLEKKPAQIVKKKGKHSLIHIENCQIKSLEKARQIAYALDILEKEAGIHEVEISFENNFICPDIDLTVLANSKDPMENLLGRLLIKLDKIKYGDKSKYTLQPHSEIIKK